MGWAYKSVAVKLETKKKLDTLKISKAFCSHDELIKALIKRSKW